MADERKQEASGAAPDALVQELNRVARESSGLGVLFGEAVARRLGITHADLECLDVVFVRGRVTAGEIAVAMGLTTGAVTGLLDRLERRAFVRRERDVVDRRKVYVTLLPTTLKSAETYYGSFEEQMRRLAASYTSDQLSLLIEFFSRAREIILSEIRKLDENPERIANTLEAATSIHRANAGPSRGE